MKGEGEAPIGAPVGYPYPVGLANSDRSPFLTQEEAAIICPYSTFIEGAIRRTAEHDAALADACHRYARRAKRRPDPRDDDANVADKPSRKIRSRRWTHLCDHSCMSPFLDPYEAFIMRPAEGAEEAKEAGEPAEAESRGKEGEGE